MRGILRGAVEQAGARKIDARADEFFAVFERPAAAVEAAVAIQRALPGRRWPDRVEVRVRVGVHVTARVFSAADGGQILVSGATRAPVATAAPAGVRFRDLGRHRLPSLAEPEPLFQVQAAGLRASFPRPRPQRRATARRHGQKSADGRGERTRAAGGQLEVPEPPG